jgi:hypothetical protein
VLVKAFFRFFARWANKHLNHVKRAYALAANTSQSQDCRFQIASLLLLLLFARARLGQSMGSFSSTLHWFENLQQPLKTLLSEEEEEENIGARWEEKFHRQIEKHSREKIY